MDMSKFEDISFAFGEAIEVIDLILFGFHNCADTRQLISTLHILKNELSSCKDNLDNVISHAIKQS